MYHIFTGKQRSLQFPVMCNACVKIDYSNNIPDTGNNDDASDDISYGLWAHTGSFTFESVITPFDINGYGNYSNRVFSSLPVAPRVLKGGTSATVNPSGGSNKIMPANDLGPNATMPTNTESETYLSSAARITHEMIIFHNTNFTLSLLNDTFHNENNPAKYKIKASFTLDSTTTTITTDNAVILPSYSKEYFYSSSDGIDQLSGFTALNEIEYRQVGTASSGSSSGNLLTLNFQHDDFFAGKQQEVYVRNGQEFELLGKVNTKSGTQQLLLISNLSRTIVSGEGIYLRSYAEPTYINEVFSVGCAYNDIGRTVDLYLNGIKVKSQQLPTTTTTFAFDNTNCYLGANGANATGAGSATTNKQFMGELHELSLVSGYKHKIISAPNLTPNLDDTLIYFRFEEIDE